MSLILLGFFKILRILPQVSIQILALQLSFGCLIKMLCSLVPGVCLVKRKEKKVLRTPRCWPALYPISDCGWPLFFQTIPYITYSPTCSLLPPSLMGGYTSLMIVWPSILCSTLINKGNGDGDKAKTFELDIIPTRWVFMGANWHDLLHAIDYP